MADRPKNTVGDAPSLGDLRKDIDRIDEAMHRLLMERGEIINRLISVKNSQETGSAFRPAREADMMRRLVKRHKGRLPLDTAESIWRRSEERRVGKECYSPCRSRWSPYH